MTQQKKTKQYETTEEVFAPLKRKLAKMLRAMTVPSLLAAIILVAFYFILPQAFHGIHDLLFSLFFLSGCPMLAYPIAFILPPLRRKGHNGARTLAFITSIVGYLGGVTYAFFAKVSPELFYVFVTYLCSGILLLFFNKVLHVRASGHSCGAVGPIVLLGLLVGGVAWVISGVIYLCALWSSLYLKRHTPKEFALGTLACLGGFILAALVYMALAII